MSCSALAAVVRKALRCLPLRLGLALLGRLLPLPRLGDPAATPSSGAPSGRKRSGSLEAWRPDCTPASGSSKKAKLASDTTPVGFRTSGSARRNSEIKEVPPPSGSWSSPRLSLRVRRPPLLALGVRWVSSLRPPGPRARAELKGPRGS